MTWVGFDVSALFFHISAAELLCACLFHEDFIISPSGFFPEHVLGHPNHHVCLCTLFEFSKSLILVFDIIVQNLMEPLRKV